MTSEQLAVLFGALAGLLGMAALLGVGLVVATIVVGALAVAREWRR